MRRVPVSQRLFSFADIPVLLLLATIIYGVIALSREWNADFQPVTEISLSGWMLPYYTLLSAVRGGVAYGISLIFSLVYGYTAAKSKTAERILIPMLDILQSIPVLGFLPGLVLGLIAIFPRTNTGLEIAAILMIFTGQAWNMTFSFYSSLKSVPSDFIEASTVMSLSWRQRLLKLELPFSAVNLAWNSLMSMAGGWFFLSVCEAFTLGDRDFRLPGIGSYMAKAVSEGNTLAMALGVMAMVTLIITMDIFFWRPVLAWVQKYRLEDVPGVAPPEPLMRLIMRESRIVRWLKLLYQRNASRRLADLDLENTEEEGLRLRVTLGHRVLVVKTGKVLKTFALRRFLEFFLPALAAAVVVWGSVKLFRVLAEIHLTTWVVLIRNTIWSLIRVIGALAMSTLWAVPFGIWVGISPRRVRIAQPIIQVCASFPAPMLYPLALALMSTLGINFDWGSMFLMMLGVQWYVLFNVLAGSLRIPRELSDALSLMDTSSRDRWKYLYLPSVFPALVTGWVTAAGGAWNASIVAEVVSYGAIKLRTPGLGSTISQAAESKDLPLLAASLSVMVVVVVTLNRTVWAKLYRSAQVRFRMDG
ncbi:ABC transporter permease subunit [Bdellovibrionota bacterium FG-2]